MCCNIKWLKDSNCNVKSLLIAKNITVIKVVLLHRLDNVNALFPLKNVYFIARIGKHDKEKQDAANSTNF